MYANMTEINKDLGMNNKNYWKHWKPLYKDNLKSTIRAKKKSKRSPRKNKLYGKCCNYSVLIYKELENSSRTGKQDIYNFFFFHRTINMRNSPPLTSSDIIGLVHFRKEWKMHTDNKKRNNRVKSLSCVP